MKKIIIIISIVLVLIVGSVALYYIDNYEDVYYTQIDNARIEKLSQVSEMKYEYTLDCYNKNGKKKQLKFKTTRELKNKAYIKLLVKISGVNKWEEVEFNEIPTKAQEKLK